MAYRCHKKKTRVAYRCHRPEGTSVHLPMSKANMAAESQNCDKFKNKMKKKCLREKRKDSGKSTKELDIIVVHRFSADGFLVKPRSTLESEYASSCLLKTFHLQSVHEALRCVGNGVDNVPQSRHSLCLSLSILPLNWTCDTTINLKKTFIKRAGGGVVVPFLGLKSGIGTS